MGISKLRLRCELGVAATISGCLDILLAVALVGAIILEEVNPESGDGDWLFSIFGIADSCAGISLFRSARCWLGSNETIVHHEPVLRGE